MTAADNFLISKKVLIGVSGSVAIYKTLDLIRLFIKSGATVKIVMSDSAKRFISPLLFETLSQNPVLHTETESWANDLNHIQAAKWADLFIIAPASANTLNKLANGIADTLLLQTALAHTRPLLIAPAANTHMMEHPATQKSMEMLQKRGAVVLDSQIKLLACNDTGRGAMAEPETIYWESARILLSDSFWENRSIIISGGGTREKIDDVRCITNLSSGKMALSLAYAAYSRGAEVTLITTQPPESFPAGMKIIPVDSSSQMHTHLQAVLDKSQSHIRQPYLFMAAAISDYLPKNPADGKLKKSDLGESWSLELEKNSDTLASLNRDHCIAIGFKAETDISAARDNAQAMLHSKSLDAVCLNLISEENPFGSESNEITLFFKDSEHTFSKMPKLPLSCAILEHLQKT